MNQAVQPVDERSSSTRLAAVAGPGGPCTARALFGALFGAVIAAHAGQAH